MCSLPAVKLENMVYCCGFCGLDVLRIRTL